MITYYLQHILNYISYIWTSTIINSFISNIYSGPTNHKQHYSHQDFPLSRSHSQSSYYFFNFYNNIHCIFIYTFVFHVFIRVSILERGLSKIENKYTLKMKCFGNNGMGDEQTLQNIIDIIEMQNQTG